MNFDCARLSFADGVSETPSKRKPLVLGPVIEQPHLGLWSFPRFWSTPDQETLAKQEPWLQGILEAFESFKEPSEGSM